MKCQPRGSRLSFVPSLLLSLLLIVIASPRPQVHAAPVPGEVTPGSLGILGKDGKIEGSCPLKHTDVRAGISGFLAHVSVTQVFSNTSTQNIEAVYAFPLPQDAAVDDMSIQIGDRTVRGVIKRPAE